MKRSHLQIFAAWLTLAAMLSPLLAQGNEFCDAISSGNLEAVKQLIENGVDASANPCGQRGPLTRALFASENSRPLVELLLKHGANPNDPGYSGISPFVLWTGVRDRDALEKLGLLMRHGADVDSSGNGLTALINAARFRNIDVISLLLKHGANPNLQPQGPANESRWAALHFVTAEPAIQGTTEDALQSARLLIKGGASVRRADAVGGCLRAVLEGPRARAPVELPCRAEADEA